MRSKTLSSGFGMSELLIAARGNLSSSQQIRNWWRCHIFFANWAWLKSSKDLKPIPPSFLASKTFSRQSNVFSVTEALSSTKTLLLLLPVFYKAPWGEENMSLRTYVWIVWATDLIITSLPPLDKNLADQPFIFLFNLSRTYAKIEL